MGNPMYFLVTYIVYVVIVPHALIYGALATGIHKWMEARLQIGFWLLFSLVIVVLTIGPVVVYHNTKKRTDHRISLLLQSDCDEMCRASGAVLVCGLFGGTKHAQACVWFKVTQAARLPAAAVAVDGRIISADSGGPMIK
jgi:hypothetical protein